MGSQQFVIMQLKVAILVSFLCSLAGADPLKDRAEGLFGLGLLPIGGETTTTAAPESSTAAAPETPSTAAAETPVDVIGNLIGGILGGGATTTTVSPSTA